MNPLVSDNAHERRHEDGDDALNGIEPTDFVSQSSNAQIVAHTGKISSPHGKLNKIHYCQTYFQIHSYDVLIDWFSLIIGIHAAIRVSF